MRVRCSLVPKGTVAQKQHASRLFPLERNSGMVQCRDTSSVTRRGAVAPLLGPIFLPERICPARIATGQRFAPGRSVSQAPAAFEIVPPQQIIAHSDVGRGEGQGYFAYGAGDVGSNPTRFARVAS